MDPVSLTLAAVGLGLQIFGGIGQAKAAHEAADISRDQARQEQGINDLKQKQMEVEARRSQMETIRNVQRAQALAVNNATAQNAQFGSGLQGGLAQTEDQGFFNLQGVNQAVEIGRGINNFNQRISQDKIQMAGAQANAATAQGMTSLGGAVMKAGPVIGQVSQGFGGKGGFGMGSLFMGGGSPSGYGRA